MRPKLIMSTLSMLVAILAFQQRPISQICHNYLDQKKGTELTCSDAKLLLGQPLRTALAQPIFGSIPTPKACTILCTTTLPCLLFELLFFKVIWASMPLRSLQSDFILPNHTREAYLCLQMTNGPALLKEV